MKNISIAVIVFTFINFYTTEIVAQSITKINKLKYQQFRIKADYEQGFANLIRLADKALTSKFKTILDKEILPVSNNKHDYFSTAVYYWKNPNTANGKPWIYKDGQYNGKALRKTDHSNYYRAMEAIRDLSLAYEYTYDSMYAKKAVFLIEQWFISDSTKMNPHLNYAQSIPGIADGYASGIIDSRAILWVINSLPILEQSEYWTAENNYRLKEWSTNFLDWLLSSKFGKKEANAKNNHSVFYDLQVATFANFIGKDELAFATIENIKTKRIEKQIKRNGKMPEELKRANAYRYSLFALSAYFHIAILAEKFGIDLWNYKGKNSGSIKDAFDFMINNAIVKDNWKYKGGVKKSQIIGMLHIASRYIDESYSILQDTLLVKGNFNKLSDIYYLQ